jgi:hypothetical protein
MPLISEGIWVVRLVYASQKIGPEFLVRRLLARRIIALLAIVFATIAYAAEPLGPDPALSPEDVVEIQLKALQRNDSPTLDAGIRQVWLLAHPDNKRVTGPLPRFIRMIKGAPFRPLIGHAAHDIERLGAADEQVNFKVTIQTSEGAVLEYFWAVGRVVSGPAKGSWMTISVFQPRRAGRAI